MEIIFIIIKKSTVLLLVSKQWIILWFFPTPDPSSILLFLISFCVHQCLYRFVSHWNIVTTDTFYIGIWNLRLELFVFVIFWWFALRMMYWCAAEYLPNQKRQSQARGFWDCEVVGQYNGAGKNTDRNSILSVRSVKNSPCHTTITEADNIHILFRFWIARLKFARIGLTIKNQTSGPSVSC